MKSRSVIFRRLCLSDGCQPADRSMRCSRQIRIGSYFWRQEPAMKKLLVALIASAFAFTAFAQAPKSDTAPKAPAKTEAKKDSTTPAPKADAKPAKGEKKAKAKGEKKAKGKGKAKSDEAKK